MNKLPKRVGIGIVGLGNIASTHARAIMGVQQAELVAACSRSETNRSSFSKNFDVTIYSDVGDLLSDDNIDVISICTPSGTHLDYGTLAADAGKHIIIEKPIEITVERGQALVDCCKKNGVKLAVIYQNRFIPEVIQLKEAINRGEIGKPVMVHASVKWFRDQDYYTGSGWRGTLDMDGGGAVINQSIHTIDLIVWLMGDISSLSSYKSTLTHPEIEAEDNAVAVMEFKNGALGVFEASTSIIPAQARWIEINGTIGTARLDGNQFSILKKNGNESSSSVSKNKTGADSPLSGMNIQYHQNQYEQIIEALIKNQIPEVTGEESLRSLAIVEAIYKSSDQNKLII